MQITWLHLYGKVSGKREASLGTVRRAIIRDDSMNRLNCREAEMQKHLLEERKGKA